MENLTARQIALWNAIVPKRSRFININSTHVVVLHFTKGIRRIRKERLGL